MFFLFYYIIINYMNYFTLQWNVSLLWDYKPFKRDIINTILNSSNNIAKTISEKNLGQVYLCYPFPPSMLFSRYKNLTKNNATFEWWGCGGVFKRGCPKLLGRDCISFTFNSNFKYFKPQRRFLKTHLLCLANRFKSSNLSF